MTTHQQEQRPRHPVDILFDHLAHFGPYPADVLPTTGRISGTAFFPGGSGLWGAQSGQPLPPMPIGEVMVLGHNFDSAASYQRSLERGTEAVNGSTWRPLITLLRTCGIAPEHCFFTNAYMGLKADNDRPTGAFPGAKDADFVRRCQNFLLLQLRIQQPRLLLTLGKEVPPLLAPLAPELNAAWQGKRTLRAIDATGSALVYPVQFSDVPHPTTVVALTHPANRAPNVIRRRYQNLEGDAAERSLLHEALRRSAEADGG